MECSDLGGEEGEVEEGSPLGDPLRRLASERLKFPELSSLYIVLLNCDFSRFTFGGFSQA